MDQEGLARPEFSAVEGAEDPGDGSQGKGATACYGSDGFGEVVRWLSAPVM